LTGMIARRQITSIQKRRRWDPGMKMSRNSTNNNPSTSSRYPNPRRTSRGSGGGGGGARGGRQTSEGNSSFHNHNAHGNDRARRRPSLSGAARAAGQHGLSLPSLNVVISTPPSAPPPLVSYHRTIQGPAATDASGCSQSCSASPPSQMLNPDRPHHNRKRIDGIPPAVAVVTCPRGNATESLASSLPASPYLVRLARSCQEHAETIHAIASPTASPTKVDQSQNDSTSEAMRDHPPSSSSVDDDGPCRDALESLHRLLPSVEASVLPSEQNYVADIGHLCDFYNNTMAGGFCPLAPQLWADPWHGTIVYVCAPLTSNRQMCAH
jgi:hypothetical protein